MASSKLAIGVDLGGTHMQVGVVDADGAIVHRLGTETRADRGPEGVITHIANTIKGVCVEAETPLESIESLGIGAPGAIDLDTMSVIEAPNLGWRDVPLADRLAKLLPGKRIIVDNDVNTALLGEVRFGAGRGASEALGVWVGTGIGGGILIGGKLHRGSLGSAGEIGMGVLFPDLPRDRMRMEHHCSRKSVFKQVSDAVDQGELSSISDLLYGDVHSMSASHLATAYEEGDEVATRIINRSADLLGIAIANSISLLAIPLVIMGGGLSEALGQRYVDHVAKSMRRHVFPEAIGDRVELRLTELRENAGLLGAAILAAEEDRSA